MPVIVSTLSPESASPASAHASGGAAFAAAYAAAESDDAHLSTVALALHAGNEMFANLSTANSSVVRLVFAAGFDASYASRNAPT